MKKIYLMMAVAATMFVACSSDDDMLTTNEENQGIKIYANLQNQASTRVSYEDTSEGTTYSTKAKWESGDRVYVAHRYKDSESSTEYKNDRPIDTSDGSFYLTQTPYTNSYIYCWYPASSYTGSVTNDATSSTCTIKPSKNQSYIFDDIAEMKSKNILVGSIKFNSGDKKGDKRVVNMHNIYALLKFTIKVPTNETKYNVETIRSWTGTALGSVEFNNGGTVTITGGSSTPAWSNLNTGRYTSSTQYNLADIGDDTYKLAEFYALVTPQTFQGLYLEIKDNAATPVSYTYTANGNVELAAGYMYHIKAKVAKK